MKIPGLDSGFKKGEKQKSNQNMRILITTPVFPPDLGGPATYVPNLAHYLSQQGHTVTVLTFIDDPAHVQSYPFQIEVVKRYFLPVRYLLFFLKALYYGRNCDLFYVCEHIALLSFLAGKMLQKPVAVRIMVDTSWEISYRYGLTTDLIDTFQEKKYGLMIGILRHLQKYWLRGADAIITVSNYLARVAQNMGAPESKIFVSYNLPHKNLIESGLNKIQARKILRIEVSEKLLLVVSRLIDWKRVDVAINVLKILSDEYKLYIIGAGPCEEELRKLVASRKLQARVLFVGQMSNKDVHNYMKAADILLLTSMYEGLSHVLLEAMHNHLPIIASNVGGNPELIENMHNGFLIEVDDVAGLKNSIERLIDNEELRDNIIEHSKEKLCRIQQNNSLERLAQKLLSIAQTRS